MSYNLGIFAGHGLGDPGAIGNGYKEADLTLELANKVNKLLSDKGVSVHTAQNNYTQVYTNSNTYDKKFALSIHFNSASESAKGAEILVPLGEKNLSLEEDILKIFVELGSVNRGLKSRDYNTEEWSQRTNGVAKSGTNYFKEINMAWSKGISLSIIEVAFVSNKEDIENYLAKKDKYALAIANAILKFLNMAEIVEEVKPVEQPTPQVTYRVKDVNGKQLNAYSNLDNAKKFAETNKAIVYDLNNKVIADYTPKHVHEKTVSTFTQSGTFYPNKTIAFGNTPCQCDIDKGTYKSGEWVKYDRVVITEKYVYISWIGSGGARRYMAIRTYNNGSYGIVNGYIK